MPASPWPGGRGPGTEAHEGFAALMERFEPFESAPHLAVAVSGGADSLALLLLLERWTAAKGGRLLALTVDHGLRPAAAAEAAWVAALCAGRGIEHRVLRWRAPRPATGLQAAARTARYRLLAEACREEGILHLVLAHQRGDQGETFLLRLEAGSGLEGLAAMPAVAYLNELRLLRPLLDTPRRALEAFLSGHGQDWLSDPSNLDPAYARVRLRSAASVLDEAGLSEPALADLVEGFGRLRRWSEAAVALLLAECCRLDPLGFAWLDRRRLLSAPQPLARLALARLLRSLGGRRHAPRGPKLDRLLAQLRREPPQAATLAGCRILPRHGERLLVVREAAAIEQPATTLAEEVASRPESCAEEPWDGRFRQARGAAAPPALRPGRVPAAARAGLPPGLLPSVDLDGRTRLPHFTANGPAQPSGPAAFAPRRSLTGGGFTVFR